jgi:hypothetical protein
LAPLFVEKISRKGAKAQRKMRAAHSMREETKSLRLRAFA